MKKVTVYPYNSYNITTDSKKSTGLYATKDFIDKYDGLAVDHHQEPKEVSQSDLDGEGRYIEPEAKPQPVLIPASAS